jgi:hypothetical protein
MFMSDSRSPLHKYNQSRVPISTRVYGENKDYLTIHQYMVGSGVLHRRAATIRA